MVTRRDNDAAELPPHLIPRTPRVSLPAAAIRAPDFTADRAGAGDDSPAAANRATNPAVAAPAADGHFYPVAAATASTFTMTNVFAGASGAPAIVVEEIPNLLPSFVDTSISTMNLPFERMIDAPNMDDSGCAAPARPFVGGARAPDGGFSGPKASGPANPPTPSPHQSQSTRLLCLARFLSPVAADRELPMDESSAISVDRLRVTTIHSRPVAVDRRRVPLSEFLAQTAATDRPDALAVAADCPGSGALDIYPPMPRVPSAETTVPESLPRLGTPLRLNASV